MKPSRRKLISLLLCAALLLALLPAGFGLTASAASEVWDGTVDISWYNSTDTEFHLYTPAQLAGLAALVNGSVDANTTDDMIIGDKSLLSNTPDPDYGFPGQSEHMGIAYVGNPDYSFANKTIYLEADMDMGGSTEHTNWMPIGGLFPTDPSLPDYYDHMVSAWFSGSINGQGHKITNLYCDRETPLFHYSQGIGLIGCLGTASEDSTLTQAPTISNLSVDGFVSGGRMAGGIVGRTGYYTDVYIINCANHAEVCGEQSKGKGGIVGVGNRGAIINCYNDGPVHTGYASAPAGGIIGDNDEMDLYCCYSVGTITAAYNRAIGSGDTLTAAYTVSDCYYLEGTAPMAWYRGSNTLATVKITGLSDAVMKSTDLVSYLNVNGAAYVYNEGGYPKLFWEQEGFSFASCAITIDKPEGGTVTTDCGSSVPTGTMVQLSHEPENGYAFRRYIVNGSFVTGAYFTAMGDCTVSASLSSMKAGVLDIPYNPACTVKVYKTGTAEINGEITQVSNYLIQSGDLVYENDVLRIACLYREGAFPEDPNQVYIGMLNSQSNLAWGYAFTYTGEEPEETASGTHTVSTKINEPDMTLTLTVYPKTTFKVWSSLADTSWYSEEEDSFVLTTPQQLAGVITLVKEGTTFEGQTIELGNDISLTNRDGSTGIRCWDGIGVGTDSKLAFMGTFDGKGYKITDMTAYSAGNYAGLFLNCRGAVIRNLTVSGSSCAAKGIAAGLVCNGANVTISDCRSFVEVSEETRYGSNGGIVSNLSGASALTRCYNYGSVSGTDKTGGIAGNINESTAVITECVNYGTVSGIGDSVSGIGGIAGYISNAGSISRCANYGDISGASLYMGGIVGNIVGNTNKVLTITKCSNTGSVTNQRSKGNAAAGGLVGSLRYAKLSDSFSSGAISSLDGSIYVGALVGRDWKMSEGSVLNCTYLDTACPWPENSGSNMRTEAGVFQVDSVDAAGLASQETVTRLNKDSSDFVMTDKGYPELAFTAASVHVHAGGIADCTALAVCTDCGCAYGQLNPANHAEYGTVLKDAKEPVWTFEGYTGDERCLGCNAILTPGQVIPADKNKIVFQVYEQFAGGEAELVKEYTAFDMTALEGAGGPYLFQYGSSTEEQQVFISADRFVLLTELLSDAGVSFKSGDKLTPENASAFSYDYIMTRDGFYYTDDSGSLCCDKVPAVLAFSYGGSNGDKAAALADCSITGGIRLCYGILESEFLNCGGFRLVGAAGHITITHPYEKSDDILKGDTDGNGQVNLRDVSAAFRFAAGLATPTEEELARADMDNSGNLDLTDVSRIFRLITGGSDA